MIQESDSMDKKIYNVNLRKVRGFSRAEKAEKSIYLLKEFVKKHAKVEKIWISPNVNEFIWVNGMRNPPKEITIQLIVDNDKAYIELKDIEFKLEDLKKKGEEIKKEEKKEVKHEDKKKKEEKKEKAEKIELPEELKKILLEESVERAKEEIKKMNRQDLEKVLKFEKMNKNRKSLIKFIESHMR